MLSITLLFTFPTESNISPFQTTQVVVKDTEGMVHKDRFGLLINPIQEQFEKDKLELDKKKTEKERLRNQKELEEQKINEPQWQEFTVSFYTGLEEENSIHGNVDCKGKPLERGVIANNVLPLGTKIFLEKDYGLRIVSDKGGNNFNNSNHIDLYVTRLDGETREQWKKRANSYGVKKIRGYIVNEVK
jgi:3D (Asp-Asp-Asp) domain-containing protein